MNREQAQKAIKGAAVCGVISTVITLIATLLALTRGSYEITGVHISIFSFVDVVLMAGLTVGLFLKNRVCAVLMFVYFVICKYLQWSAQIRGISPVNGSSFVFGLFFLYFYFRGILGTFAFQKLKNEDDAALPPYPPEIR